MTTNPTGTTTTTRGNLAL